MTTGTLLRNHVEMLGGTIGERNLWQYGRLQRAADYISETFISVGFDPSRQFFDVSQVPVCNIEAELTGTSRRDEIVVLGAHYDSVPHCPGANDNATGVAALLELSRRLAGRPHARSIRFVAFVNEEPPFFQTARMGSVVYANAAKARRDRIVAMVALETMGYYCDTKGSQRYPAPMALMYPDRGNFIGFVSNIASGRLLLEARRAFKQRSRFPMQAAMLPAAVPGVGWSDHWSFWQAGYPAIMVTDTAPFRYPWYHSPADTPDKICFDRFEAVVHGLEHVATRIANP